MKRLTLLVALFCCCWFTGASFAQDECSSAIPVFIGINPGAPSGSSGSTFSNVGMTTSAGGPALSCGSGAAAHDMWFVFTSGAAGSYTFSTDTPAGFAVGTHTDTTLQVTDGAACPPTTQLACDDDSGSNPGFSSIATAALAASTTYYIRVFSYDAFTADGSFYLTISAPAAPPSNDECSAPIQIFDGVNPGAPSGSSGFAFSNNLGTNSAGIPAACASISRDVWFSYTATGTGSLNINTCTPAGFSAGTVGDTVLQVFGNACPPTTSLACNDDSCGTRSSLTLAVTFGTTYLMRVGTFGASGAGGTFYITLAPPPPPPANDECSNAIAIVEGENGPFSNATATNSVGFDLPAGCAFSNAPGNKDVFFLYTEPSTCGGTVEVKTCNPVGFTGTNTDTVISAYPAGDCPTPGAPLACNDDSCGLMSTISFPTTGGASYLIRVGSWGGSNGTFKVTVTRHTASSSLVGPGCSDGGGPGPSLSIDAPPVLGSLRTLTVAGAVPASAGMLLFSNPAPFPSPLTGGCNLYLEQGSMIFLGFFATDGTGSFSLSANAPSDPAAECLAVTVQGVIFPAGGAPFYQVTDGLGLILGY